VGSSLIAQPIGHKAVASVSMLLRQGAVVNGSGVRVPISVDRLARNQDRTVAVGSDALD
jgi:hypothetical protein